MNEETEDCASMRCVLSFYVRVTVHRDKLLFNKTNNCSRGIGDLEVACWPLVPKFECSNPAEVVGTLVESGLQSALNQCTVQTFTEGKDTRCCVNTIFPPEDGRANTRNMSRIIV